MVKKINKTEKNIFPILSNTHDHEGMSGAATSLHIK